MARSSQRDRMELLRAEAEIAAAERAAKAAAREAAKAAKADGTATPKRKTTTRRKAAAAAPARVRIVLHVCDSRGTPVERFKLIEEVAAKARAEELTEEVGKTHFVTRGEVPWEE